MKKISVVFAFLLMMNFSGVASSAILTWSSVPPEASITSNNGSIISAQFGFAIKSTQFSHAYNFTSSDLKSLISAELDELPRNGIRISSIRFDNKPMQFDRANKFWFGTGANILDHTINIVGTSRQVGSQYQLNAEVSAVPIPAAIWLFGTALLGLVSISTRGKISKALSA